MACCDNIIKCLLFLVNFIFALSGLAVLAIGVLAYLQYDDFNKLLESEVASPPIIFMILGSVIFVVAFYGCCGACCESSCMLITYGVLLIVILIAQVAVAVVALMNKTDMQQVLHQALTKEFDSSVNSQASVDFLKNLQTSAQCCGVDGPTDYWSHLSWPRSLQESCCRKPPCPTAEFSAGCARTLAGFVQNYATIIGGVGIGIGVIEILGAISGFALASFINRQY